MIGAGVIEQRDALGSAGWRFTRGPMRKGIAPPLRKLAAWVESQQLFVQSGPRHPVGKRRERAAQLREIGGVTQRARLQRRAVTRVVVCEKFALVTRHVDAHRALRLARAAFETQV